MMLTTLSLRGLTFFALQSRAECSYYFQLRHLLQCFHLIHSCGCPCCRLQTVYDHTYNRTLEGYLNRKKGEFHKQDKILLVDCP